jgi:hypothetical protein
LPGRGAKLCSRLFEDIIAELDAGTPPDAIADEFGQCSSSADSLPVHSPKRTENHACDACQDAIQYVAEIVRQRVPEAKVGSVVNEICVGLPSPIDAWARAFLEETLEVITPDLTTGSDSAATCAKLGLCRKSAKERKAKRPRSVPKSRDTVMGWPGEVSCTRCQGIVEHTVELVLTGLQDKCGVFTGATYAWCRNFVDESSDGLVADIRAGIEDMCRANGICSMPDGDPASYGTSLQRRLSEVEG